MSIKLIADIRAQLDELEAKVKEQRIVSNRMSNCLYNLCQDVPRMLSEHDRKCMREMYELWDKVKNG